MAIEPIYTGRHEIERAGEVAFAEVSARFRPHLGTPTVHFSGAARRSILATYPATPVHATATIYDAIALTIGQNGKRLARWPGIQAWSFQAEVVAVQVAPGLDVEEAEPLLAEAARRAARAYFRAVDADPGHAEAPDPEAPFSYRPELGFDEAFLARLPGFLDYAAERRRRFLYDFGLDRIDPVDDLRHDRTLTPRGIAALESAVTGYLIGCRPEADETLARSVERLELAEAIGEKPTGDYRGGWGLGHRDAALAFGRWLRTGEPQPALVERARKHLMGHYRRTKGLDRPTADLAAPTLLYLGADEVLRVMADRLRIDPTGANAPPGLFGDALRLAHDDRAARDRLLAQLRRRLPLHLVRWIIAGRSTDAAFVLHALFPHPEGPPTRLVEAAWDVLPPIERHRDRHNEWDVRKPNRRATIPDQAPD